MVSSADFWRSTTLLERQFYVPRAFKKLLLSHISKMFLQNNAWYSRFVVLFNLGIIYFLKSRERSWVQKEAFGGITSTVDYLNCQVRSKSRGPVRRLMHLVQWTEIPMNFLKDFYFPRVGEGVSDDCRNASLSWSAHLTQDTKFLILIAEFQQLYRHVSWPENLHWICVFSVF